MLVHWFQRLSTRTTRSSLSASSSFSLYPALKLCCRYWSITAAVLNCGIGGSISGGGSKGSTKHLPSLSVQAFSLPSPSSASLSTIVSSSRYYKYRNRDNRLKREVPNTSNTNFYGQQRSMTSTAMTLSSSTIHGQTFVSIEDAIALHPSSSASSESSGKERTNMVFVDGSWFLPTLGRNGREEFLEGPRIEGARFLDIDDIATPTTTTYASGTQQQLPHMMPSASLFSSWMDAMDVSTEDHIIVYGSKQCPFVSRAFWNIRTFHQPNLCHLLDGSLQDWIEANGPIEAQGTQPKFPVVTAAQLPQSSSPSEPKYKPRSVNPNKNVVDLTQIQKSIMDGRIVKSLQSSLPSSMIIVDARSNGRFIGVDDEPRPGLRKGHMPGAINIPFNTLLQESNMNRFLPRDDLRSILEKNGLVNEGDDGAEGNNDDARTTTMIVSSCGSGVTASCLLVALTSVLGPDRVDDVAYLYDGSWIEWGGSPDTPIVTEE